MDDVVAGLEPEDAHQQKSPGDGSLDEGRTGMTGAERRVPGAGCRKIQQTSHRKDPLRAGLLRQEALQRVDPPVQTTGTVGVLEVDEPVSEKLRARVEVCLLFSSR